MCIIFELAFKDIILNKGNIIYYAYEVCFDFIKCYTMFPNALDDHLWVSSKYSKRPNHIIF